MTLYERCVENLHIAWGCALVSGISALVLGSVYATFDDIIRQQTISESVIAVLLFTISMAIIGAIIPLTISGVCGILHLLRNGFTRKV